MRLLSLSARLSAFYSPKGNLFAATAYLKQMRHLKYLTFMAGEPSEGEDPTPHTLENERSVVGAWGDACPTLRSVILPKGQLWYEQQGKWRSGALAEKAEEPTPGTPSTLEILV